MKHIIRRVVLIIILMLFVLPLSVSGQTAMTDEEIRTNIQRVVEEAFNQGDLAVIDEVFDEDYMDHTPDSPEPFGLEDFKNGVMALRAAMPDFQASADLIVIEGNWVAFRFTASGTFENEYPATDGTTIAPTGEPVYFSNIIILRLNEEGEVVEAWEEFDNLGFITQVGLFPNLSGEAFAMEEAAPAMMETSNEIEAANKETMMRLFDEINTGNLDVIDEIYTEDHLGHDPGSDTTREQGKEAIMTLKNAMPDLNISVDPIMAQGDLVAFRVTYSGTFTNELNFAGQTFPPTNQPVVVTQNIISRFNENGQIAEEWIEYDRLGLFIQLGVIPMPE